MAKALERKGKRARLLLSWDEFDRCVRCLPMSPPCRIPPTEDCIGKPYVDVRNPFRTDAPTYAAYFEREFRASIERFGIRMEYRHRAELYRSGATGRRSGRRWKSAMPSSIFWIPCARRTPPRASARRTIP